MPHLLLAWVPTLYGAVRRAVPPWSPRVPRTYVSFVFYRLYSLANPPRLNGIPFASGCDEAYITLSVALRRRPLPLNGRRRPRVTPTVTPPRDRSVGACALQQRAGKRPPPSACSPPRKRQRPREMGSPVRGEPHRPFRRPPTGAWPLVWLEPRSLACHLRCPAACREWLPAWRPLPCREQLPAWRAARGAGAARAGPSAEQSPKQRVGASR